MSLALVLSGGGGLGAFEAGVVEVLDEAGVRPDVYSGTSAGALNAAALASGIAPRELSDVWRRVRAEDVYRTRGDVWSLLDVGALVGGQGNVGRRLLDAVGWTYLLETAPLRRTVVDVLGGEGVRVRRGVTLVVSAVDVATGEAVRFCSSPPPPRRLTARFRTVALDVDHLLASSAIPLLFEPARVGGQDFWDGGVVANTPLAPALAFEPDVAIVVQTSTQPRPAPPPASLGDAVGLLLDTLIGYSLKADLEHARTVNQLCAAGPAAPEEVRRPVQLLVISPAGVDLGGSLDFSQERAESRIAAGRELATREVERWRAEGTLPA